MRRKTASQGRLASVPRTVGVIGLGLMGSSIAACFVRHGFSVTGYARRAATARRSVGYVRGALQDLQRNESHGLRVGALLHRYRATTSIADLARCEFVVESIIEDQKGKQRLIAELERVLSARAVIASNTS